MSSTSPDAASPASSARPSPGRILGLFWSYTLARVAVFAVLYVVLALVGLDGWVGVFVAMGLSIPLSMVLLARPRARLAEALQQQADARSARQVELRKQLRGEDDDASGADEKSAR